MFRCFCFSSRTFYFNLSRQIFFNYRTKFLHPKSDFQNVVQETFVLSCDYRFNPAFNKMISMNNQILSISSIKSFNNSLTFMNNNIKLNSVVSLSTKSDDYNKQNDHLTGSISHLLVQNLPQSIRPYAQLMRLDKPTGTWLLLLPCWWSIGLSTPAGSIPSIENFILFGLGAVLMRSAGCIINDIWDRKYDRDVQRTKNRPLASKAIPLSDAVALLASLLGSSLLILIQFDVNSIILGMTSLLLVSTYPSFKRFTYWPQFILGMTFNWGALLGWSVNCNGSLQLDAVLPLYVAGICWTLIYDTIYAHQDKNDDLVLGLKSTALKFGSNTWKYLNGFTVLMTTSLLITGLQTEQTFPYYLSLAILTLKLLQINRNLDVNSVASCAKAFKENTRIGWILFLGIILSTLVKTVKKRQETAKNDNFLKYQLI